MRTGGWAIQYMTILFLESKGILKHNSNWLFSARGNSTLPAFTTKEQFILSMNVGMVISTTAIQTYGSFDYLAVKLENH